MVIQPAPVQQVKIATALLQALIVVYTVWFAGIAYVFKTGFVNPGLIEQQTSYYIRIIRSLAISGVLLQILLSLTVLVLSRYSSPLLKGTLVVLLLVAGAVVASIQYWATEQENDPPTGWYLIAYLLAFISTTVVIFIIALG